MLLRNIYIFILLFIIGSVLFVTCRKFSIYNFKSNLKGKKIILIGGTHGNEESGSLALNKIIFLLKNNFLKLKKGKITIIPNFNTCGLYLNSRYYSKIGKKIDLNRLYGKNFIVNKNIEKLIENYDLVIDLHEGWSFHKINKNSIGSTIVTKNIKKKNVDFILINLNKTIKDKNKKFTSINPPSVKYSLKNFIDNNYPEKQYLLVETTGQNNIQPLHIRVNQVLNIISSVFSIYDIL